MLDQKCNITFFQNDNNEMDSFRREIAVDRVIIAVDAALTSLYIMTAPDMPKQVYIEDVIEKLVMMVKTQLQNTIYPEFDPVYRIDNKRMSRNKLFFMLYLMDYI